MTVWKDYWDFWAIVNSAPASWMESLAASDTSWVFDATGLI
ncbi:MAG: limA [Mycobacterium sp.]|nr:limA [Mycobacterium sp.]